MTATASSTTRRPAVFSTAVAVVATLLAVVLLNRPAATRSALVVELGGLALLAVGLELRSRDRDLVGLASAGGGLVVLVAAVAFAATNVSDRAALLSLLPGMVGLFVLSLGLVPLTGAGSRGFVKLGTAAVFAGVVVTGVFQSAETSILLAAGAATVVAWDVGENAINVGEHLGRAASTVRVELVHVGASAVVAAAAVASGLVIGGVGTPALSLPALASLLVATLLLVAALHE